MENGHHDQLENQLIPNILSASTFGSIDLGISLLARLRYLALMSYLLAFIYLPINCIANILNQFLDYEKQQYLKENLESKKYIGLI